MLLGSHLSISGGPHKALERAAEYGFGTVAMFVRNQVRWAFRPLDPRAARHFRAVRKRLGIGPVVAHASYLVNLAAEGEVRGKSIDAMVEDLTRCGDLGIEYLVFHPGSNDDPRRGARRIAEAVDEVLARCPRRRPKLLLETTAGMGRSVGHRFEQLAEIVSASRRPRRLGVCLDTCHVFAAGYDLRSREAYERTLAEFDRVVGLDRLAAIHLNDSKRPLGSRVDRHEHIGRGRLGRRAFRNLIADERLAGVPKILETPKGRDTRGRDWDEINAAVLRRMERRPRRDDAG